MADKFYVGDTPLVKLDCVSDIAGATGTKIYYKKPDGTASYWDADILDNRYLTYQIPDNTVLDIAGDWKFQSYMTVGVWTGYGETAIQRIYEVFK